MPPVAVPVLFSQSKKRLMHDRYGEMASSASKITIGGSAGGLFFGGLDFSELMALISVFIAFSGLLASVYFQYQRNKMIAQEMREKLNKGEEDDR